MSEVVLVEHAAVHRDQNIELEGGPGEQSAVARACPTDQWHRFYFMTGQAAGEPPVEILIEENLYRSGRLQDVRARFFKDRDDLLTSHTGESFEKIIDRISRFEVIEETAHRDPGGGKYALPAEDLRIGAGCGDGGHAQNLAGWRGTTRGESRSAKNTGLVGDEEGVGLAVGARDGERAVVGELGGEGGGFGAAFGPED